MAKQQRNKNMDKLKPLLGVLAGVLLVAAIIAAVVMRVKVISPRVDKLCKEEPYLALQATGEFRSAYDKFTTADYQKQFPFEEVLRFHEELLAKNGKVTGKEFVRDSAPFFEKEGESIYQISYRVLYEKGSVRVIFELVPTQGSYRIISTNVEATPGSLRLRPY